MMAFSRNDISDEPYSIYVSNDNGEIWIPTNCSVLVQSEQ